jgi:hypothetical protein
MNKRYFVSLLTGVMFLSANAQVSSTLSPYSQYGMGVLADQSQGFNRGMGGVAYGLRSGNIVNMKNPASYSAVDSLTMLLDVGVTGQITNYKEGNKSLNSKTGNFDYAVASFRLLPKVGVAVGVVPFSNIGYTYNHTEKVASTSATTTYSGDGGFSQAFFGTGWEFAKGFSVGANISYFWGKYSKTIPVVSSESNSSTITRVYSTNVSSYKLDLGAQWQQLVTKKDLLTIGVTAGLGHQLHGDADLQIINTNSSNSSSTERNFSVADAFKLPHMLGVGASIMHNHSLTIAADYTFQKWSDIDYPVFDNTKYEMKGGIYQNRHQIAAGVDWEPNPLGRKFLQLVHYRLGVSYATPYYKIGTQDGPSEMTVSAGFGIPIYNSWNNRSILNISAQWVRNSASGFVKENTFRINIGLTFNERWFAKWKVD